MYRYPGSTPKVRMTYLNEAKIAFAKQNLF